MANPQFILIALNCIQSILENDTAELLANMATPRDAFREFKWAFTGMMVNPPTVWIMPRTTQISDEGQLIEQVHLVTVRIGLMGGDPEDIAHAAVDYMTAVDLALRNAAVSELDETILHLHPQEHDYGPLFQGNGGFAKFPELHVAVESVELPE